MKRYQNFPVVLPCLVVSGETVLKILKSLLCYLLKNKMYNFCPYFCCSFLPMHFWEEAGAGEFAVFDQQ